MDYATKIQLYETYTYVLNLLLSNACYFTPRYVYLIDAIENVQRNCRKLLSAIFYRYN